MSASAPLHNSPHLRTEWSGASADMRRVAWIGLTISGILALIRFTVLGTLPLNDPSEGRFASSAMHMVVSQDWITPHIHRFGEEWVPYWAKPPFHMWLTALSLIVCGPYEWSARLPSFVASLLCGGISTVLATRIADTRAGCIAPWIFLSSFAPFLFFPFCLTDATLSLAISSAYLSFYLAIFSRQRRWGYLFFLSLAVATLTKGPVGVVLPLCGIALWICIERNVRALSVLPWARGTALFFIVTCPWYFAAEHQTPGFLRYFLWEENVMRYLQQDFHPKFGTAHSYPYGSIWLMLVACASPWILLITPTLCRPDERRRLLERCTHDPHLRYALCWAVTPPLFFTFARQVLPTYVFSALPSIAVLLAIMLRRKPLRWIASAALIFAALQGIGLALLAPTLGERRSTRDMLAYMDEQLAGSRVPVAILYSDPPTAHFYAGPRRLFDRLEIHGGRSWEYARLHGITHVLIQSHDLRNLPSEAGSLLTLEKELGKWRYYTMKR